MVTSLKGGAREGGADLLGADRRGRAARVEREAHVAVGAAAGEEAHGERDVVAVAPRGAEIVVLVVVLALGARERRGGEGGEREGERGKEADGSGHGLHLVLRGFSCGPERHGRLKCTPRAASHRETRDPRAALRPPGGGDFRGERGLAAAAASRCDAPFRGARATAAMSHLARMAGLASRRGAP
jgi:hypothetical protein